jgi:translation initiation factor IF-1
MAKEELIQFEGLVTEILPDARYRVQLDAGHEIVAYTAGKMKKNRIKTLAGDRVTIEMSPYDLEKGRLIFRHKEKRPGAPPRALDYAEPKSRTSGLFWEPPSHNMDYRFSAGRH